MSLDDVCYHLGCATSQRKTEVDAGLGTSGTMGFEDRGCYSCDGLKKDCNCYIPKSFICGDKK